MESFDVIIVGAGPAGLKCAETLGGSRLKVLLVEKNTVIGPKICAGGLTGKDIEYLHLPQELVDFSFNAIKLRVTRWSSHIRHEYDFAYTIDRKNLGQWQLKKLDQYQNVEVRPNSKVSEIGKNYIVLNGEKIAYTFLVGADGSASIVRKYVGIKSRRYIIAIQYIIPNTTFKEFEVFFDSRLFSAWYAWIFPHKNYVSIGCGCDPRVLSASSLISHFKNWLSQNGIDVSMGRYESFMLDYDYQGHHFGNVFLAGDAGGFVSGFTGEGIYPALISGEEVGKMILNPGYQSSKISDLLHLKKKHNWLMYFLIKCGWFRNVIFLAGMLLFKVPYLKKKAINLLA
jgi:geranylgeranyl reductase